MGSRGTEAMGRARTHRVGVRAIARVGLLSLLSLSACTGNLGVDGLLGSDAERGPDAIGDGVGLGPDGLGPNGTGGPGQPGEGPNRGDGDPASATEGPAPASRVPRLTHSQWLNTVTDLLYLDDTSALTTMLRDDPHQGGFLFDNDGSTLVVDGALLQGYQAAAGQLAEYVASDPTRLAKLTGDPVGSEAARRDAFLDRFLPRAHRRPVLAPDRNAYAALFDAGASLYPGMSAFDAGVRGVVEAALQAPAFLYRTELSTSVGPAGTIPLDGHEIAGRLAYFLWNTMPDEALFAAAVEGALDARGGIEAQVTRMLADPRAEATVQNFHAQLLETGRWRGIRPSRDVYSVSDQLGNHAIEEQQRFVAHVFAQGGSLAALLTSRETFVNDELAAIYGLPGTYDANFTRVSLDRDERAGLFTHVGFLSGNASSVDPDPIHRGKFLAERMTCKQITAPPTVVPPPPVVSDKTNRERIADYTEMPGSACASCHATLINPFGFPFERYDAVGAYRTLDRGKPVDSESSPYLDGKPVPVADAVELAQRMAESEETHRCYVKHWLEFAHGRPEHDADEGQLARLTQASLADDASLSTLLAELVLSDAFLTRSAEEAP